MKIWMQPPTRGSAPIEVEATHEVLVPLMVQGHTQCWPEQAPNPEPLSPAEPDEASAKG